MGAVVMAIGKMRYAPYRTAADAYLQRLSHYLTVREVELKGVTSSKLNAMQIREQESQQFLSALDPTDYVFVLDERGKMLSSTAFSEILGRLMLQSQNMVFTLGGAYGHHASLRQRANCVLSLSPMTFPHELARVLVYEQIYRAMTILRNEPYHKA